MVKITLNKRHTPLIRSGAFLRGSVYWQFASNCDVKSRAAFNRVNRVKPYLANVNCAKVELVRKMISELKT